MECIARAPSSFASYFLESAQKASMNARAISSSIYHQNAALCPPSVASLPAASPADVRATTVTMAALEYMATQLSRHIRPLKALRHFMKGRRRTSEGSRDGKNTSGGDSSGSSEGLLGLNALPLPAIVPCPIPVVATVESNFHRASAIAHSQAAAAAEPLTAPMLNGSARLTSSLLVSFLVNYSVLVSDWWQFKSTARDHLFACLGARWPLAVTAVHTASDSNSAAAIAATAAAAAAVAAAAAAKGTTSTRTRRELSPASLIRKLSGSWGGLRAPANPHADGCGERTGSEEDDSTEEAAERAAVAAFRKGITEGDGRGARVAHVVADGLDPHMVWAQRQMDVDAEDRRRDSLGEPGFSFSAAGLLFPYHLGVAQYLLDHGYITESTPLAGASAGALVSAVVATGVEPRSLMPLAKLVAADCRKNGTAFRIGVLLRGVLNRILPDDAHIKCSGRIRVAITQVFGSPRGWLVDAFESKEDLIDALITSSFVPGYLEPRATTSFRNRTCVDGGISHFIPPTASEHTVRVCAFPASGYGLTGTDIDPDMNTLNNNWTMRQYLSWALEPAEDDVWDGLFNSGYADAATWASTYTGPLYHPISSQCNTRATTSAAANICSPVR
ncbi:unnamed protein product [Closterium sp. Naga37s-1]|nr:unnamed protein product [Closterium sp. Naga37s-1]